MRAPRARRGLEALEVQHAGARRPARSRPALALIGRDAFSGCVVPLARQHAHAVEAGPAVVAVALAAAAQHALGEPHADAVGAVDDRLGAGAAGAAVGRDLVAEREQPAHPRRDAAAHHLLDDRRAEAAHLAGVGHRHELPADRVEAADARCRAPRRLPSRRGRRCGRAARSRRPSRRRPRRSSRSGGSSSSPAAGRSRSRTRRSRPCPAARRRRCRRSRARRASARGGCRSGRRAARRRSRRGRPRSVRRPPSP